MHKPAWKNLMLIGDLRRERGALQPAGEIWSTGTWGKVTSTFIMQTDVNLVLYPSSMSALWNTATGNKAGASLWLQQDCNLVVYSAGGTPL
ncbi:hypothetical protein [Melittangium boletus]|uniref:Peptidase S8 n=1 Tax=Melittangium boletus DSM 14713 TaxID=1294270 RepID=A0A250IF01_9BACT|nr:hypothetical protein [Melittangium boletus]ATB29721.1 peptidase S8 [Melittangium boletus DSM 14713]